MKLNDTSWAWIGKSLAFLAVAIPVVLGLFQLVDRFTGPRLVAIISVAEYHISPEVKEEIAQAIDPESITKLIDAETKRGKRPQQILDSVRERVNDKDFSKTMFDLQHAFAETVLTVRIENRSDDLSEHVRLILPGSGWAQMTEFSVMPRDVPALTWKGELPIGAIRPGAIMNVIVWPKDAFLWRTEHYQPSLVHSKGAGTVQWVRQFYGWDADLVAWYIAQPAFTRYGLLSLFIIIVVAALWYAVTRKHLVFSIRGTPR